MGSTDEEGGQSATFFSLPHINWAGGKLRSETAMRRTHGGHAAGAAGIPLH
jgi:hypothetical protein